MFTSAVRITNFAFQSFWRNFWLAFITVSMLVLTLLTINISLVLNLLASRALTFVEDRVEVSVYFNENVTETKMQNVADYLRGLRQVKDVKIYSADQVLERFKERHAKEPKILASLDEVKGNPFGPTAVVSARSVGDFDFILEALNNPQFRNDIKDKDFSDYQTLITKISTMVGRIRWFGMILAAIFLCITTLIVFNTVRMGIFTHRDEIAIMKLVGASNWFVRSPFLLEVIFYAFLATVIVAAAVLPAVAAVEPIFSVYFGGAPAGILSFFQDNMWMIFGLEFLGLAVISIVATLFAMRHYLKV